ncbi:MAG: PLD nuclease N-terminal domain-containing protein [Coriobacteriales bacterium]|jgi:hypothetical protein|nr:PLD nuclease N-terminal domain-containing protein [Coriobacteriales bacterium]
MDSIGFDLLKLLADYWIFLLPLALIQLGLMIAALIHIFKHANYKVGKRWMWVVIVCLVSTIGPIIYFIIGRGEN